MRRHRRRQAPDGRHEQGQWKRWSRVDPKGRRRCHRGDRPPRCCGHCRVRPRFPRRANRTERSPAGAASGSSRPRHRSQRSAGARLGCHRPSACIVLSENDRHDSATNPETDRYWNFSGGGRHGDDVSQFRRFYWTLPVPSVGSGRYPAMSTKRRREAARSAFSANRCGVTSAARRA